MKLFKAGILVLFVGTMLLFGHYFYNANFNVDKTYPVIEIDKDEIEVPLNATDEDLLVGVTAYDEKDGDLTEKVMVESISKFISKGVCTVTYAVVDKDKHVAEKTRTVSFNNYTSPKFTMKSSFCFPLRGRAVIKDVVGAIDCIDGDISNKVIITSADYESNTLGTFSCTVKITNSMGDTSVLEIPIVVDDRSTNAPVINLTDYLIYVKKGSHPDFNKYVESVTDGYDVPLELEATFNTEFNSNKPGLYTVHYYTTDSSDRTGHTILIVVVEE